MGNKVAATYTSFNYGYISPKLRGRIDLPFYTKSFDYLKNYDITPQGETRYRGGTRMVSATKGGAAARLIPFLYNTEQAYQVELTDQAMRFYKDHGLITNTPIAITAITKAAAAQISCASHGFSAGDPIFFSGVIGMTQINGQEASVASVVDANNFTISLNTSAYSTYVSAGTAAKIVQITTPYAAADLFNLEYTQTNNEMYIVHEGYAPRKLTRSSHTSWSLSTFTRTTDPFTGADLHPSAVTLFEGRIVYAASNTYPTRLWFSKAGSLDDLTTGTNDADGMIFTIRSDQANRIRNLIGAENYLVVGTSGAEFRVAGGGENGGITPTNISVKPTSFNGVARVRPVRLDSYILYVQRNGKTVRSNEYSALKDGYVSPDRTLIAEQIASSGIKQLSYTAGSPNYTWAVKNNGDLIGLSFDPSQEIVAWHLHETDGEFYSVSTIPETTEDDELWCVVKRTIGATTKYYVEYFPNLEQAPVPEDYFTGVENKADDGRSYLDAYWNYQRRVVHCDSALTYDGRENASVSLTIAGSLTAGSTVTVTAGSSFFASGMVGRRVQFDNGGQVEVTAYTSSTVVTAVVLLDLNAASFAANKWYYMTQAVTGLSHLEGKSVAILADGGVVEDKTVVNGTVTLDDYYGYITVGLYYTGIGKLNSLEGGGENGPAQTKERVVSKLGVVFRSSLGTSFGTSLYAMENPSYRIAGDLAGRAPRLIDGTVIVQITDGFSPDKNIYWMHRTPLPSNIQLIRCDLETND